MAEYQGGVSGVVVIRSVNQVPGPDRRNVIIPNQSVAANTAIRKYSRKKHRSATTVQVSDKVKSRNNKVPMEDVSYILCFTWKRDFFEFPLPIVFHNLGLYSYWLLESKYQQERCSS